MTFSDIEVTVILGKGITAMMNRRLVSTIIITLWLIFLFFLSVPIREEISCTYHTIIASSKFNSLGSLPTLTKEYTLRILGSGNLLVSNTDIFFYLFWGFIWVVPFIMLFFTWRIKEPIRLMEFLLYSWLGYLFLMAFLFILAIFGLIGPFLYLC